LEGDGRDVTPKGSTAEGPPFFFEDFVFFAFFDDLSKGVKDGASDKSDILGFPTCDDNEGLPFNDDNAGAPLSDDPWLDKPGARDSDNLFDVIGANEEIFDGDDVPNISSAESCSDDWGCW